MNNDYIQGQKDLISNIKEKIGKALDNNQTDDTHNTANEFDIIPSKQIELINKNDDKQHIENLNTNDIGSFDLNDPKMSIIIKPINENGQQENELNNIASENFSNLGNLDNV